MSKTGINGLDKQQAMLMLATDSVLNGAAKAVGCVLLDHYNLDTGLCFPSTGLLAVETGLTERTIRRARRDLKKAGWITWERYGSIAHSNLYEINWQHYRAIADAYEARKDAHRHRFNTSDNRDNPVPVGTEIDTPPVNSGDPHRDNPVRQLGQPCPGNRDNPVPQNLEVNLERNREHELAASLKREAVTADAMTDIESNNLMFEEGANPSDSERVGETEIARQEAALPSGAERTTYRPRRVLPKQPNDWGSSSADVANYKAEERWHKELNARFIGTTDEYGAVLEALTDDLQSAATAAEIKRHGAGLQVVLERLASPPEQDGAGLQVVSARPPINEIRPG